MAPIRAPSMHNTYHNSSSIPSLTRMQQQQQQRQQQQQQSAWAVKAQRDNTSPPLSPSASVSSHSDASPPPTTTKQLANPTPPRAQGGAKAGRDGKGARKKVAKACLACQKSHLTCDECRPCTRCMKKGIGDQCVEGVRKKAKYLMEGDERAAPPPAPPAPAVAPPPPVPASLPSMSPPAPTHFGANIPVTMLPGVVAGPPQPIEPTRVPDNIWLTAPLPEVQAAPPTLSTDWSLPNDTFSFTNNTANLEYEMFDSLFGSLSPSFPLGADMGTSSSGDNSTPSMWSNFGLGDPNTQAQQADSVLLTPQDNADSGSGGAAGGINPMLAADLSPHNVYGANGWTPKNDGNGNEGGNNNMLDRPKKLTPEDVYALVVKPYDYTEGYHVLMQYLTNNFQKDEILRVVKALAVFRPSLIALQMPLSEEDEVFLERSFQRTLIELDKLISFSATPTAVWRRTGELVCVAPQFCTLTGKSEDEMLRSRSCTYIYQLFSKQAVIDYWENFAEHAFENTTQNFFQATTLETAKGSIPCAACFTIRRDVFDLPSVVIGQFLPIPPEAA